MTNEGEILKDDGMGLAAENRADLLRIARGFAREIALGRQDRTLSADAVRHVMRQRGYDMDELGPAAGSIFKGKAWEFTGSRVKSVHPANHARELKLWRLK